MDIHSVTDDGQQVFLVFWAQHIELVDAATLSSGRWAPMPLTQFSPERWTPQAEEHQVVTVEDGSVAAFPVDSLGIGSRSASLGLRDANPLPFGPTC